MQWVRSHQQAALFDDFFVHVNPTYLSQCSALLTLSVSATVTTTLETNVLKRLEWLEVVLGFIDPKVYLCLFLPLLMMV